MSDSAAVLCIAQGRILALCKRHETLDGNDEFPLRLVVQNVRRVFFLELVAPGALMNTGHGNTHWPRRVADGHLQIAVVGLDVLFRLAE